MKKENAINFIQLVVKAIQTDYDSQRNCAISLESVLNEADKLHIELTGNPIVKRRETEAVNLINVIAGQQPLSRIKPTRTNQQ